MVSTLQFDGDRLASPRLSKLGFVFQFEAYRDLITRMFPLAEEAMKTLANFHSTVMAGLDPAIQSQLERPCFFWMAASKGGHDDGIGGNIRVIKNLNGHRGQLVPA